MHEHERKRLHISPFDPELLSIVLPADIFHLASNISFHTVQTSQHKSYGYVDLPTMPADKLKKKLNGSILKGSKMRVEEARPEKVKNTSSGDEKRLVDGLIQEKARRGKRKADRVDGVIPGIELPGGRKVRRGWTEPALTSNRSKTSKSSKEKHDKKPKPKSSSFTNEPECLFKTKLPPNAAVTPTQAKKRKREHSGHEVVIHEFENTTKHASFLRDIQGAIGSESSSEYIKGKGWIDRNGNILEEDPVLERTRLNSGISGVSQLTERSKQKQTSEIHVSSKTPSIQISDSGKLVDAQDLNDETSSSGTSSSSASDSESDPSAASVQRSDHEMNTHENTAENLSSDDEVSDHDTVAGQIKTHSTKKNAFQVSPDPSSETNAPVNEIHPLEALFKRPKIAASSTPKKPSLEVSTSFNFFDPDVEEGTNTGHLVPHTPFTQQDFRERRQRSAAPTPDTAAPGKTFGNLWAGTSESDNEEMEEKNDDAKEAIESGLSDGKNHAGAHDGGGGGDEKPESEFSKWFWEHRGETNRAWKRRRREAAKEKRQKDNKKK